VPRDSKGRCNDFASWAVVPRDSTGENGVVAMDPRHGGSAEAADPRRGGSAAATATLAMAGRSAGERRRSGTASGGRR
jgi:hypothetical protein